MKSERHKLILQIVRTMDISSQKQLQEELEKRGMTVTQATLSRDINELTLLKVPSGTGVRYAVPKLDIQTLMDTDRAAYELFRNAVIGADHAMNTVVIKCRTGMAQAVCAKLDEIHIENAVGTIAGDDTIFMLMRSLEDAGRTNKELDLIISR